MRSKKRQEKTAKDRAPMCRLCGHRHWSRDPHQLSKVRAKRLPR